MSSRLNWQHWICLIALCAAVAPSAHALTILTRATVIAKTEGTDTAAHVADARLPYSWDSAQRAVDGSAQFLVHFTSANHAEPHALFTRIGNIFTVTLNGVEIARMGTPGNKYEDYAKEPRYIAVPPGVLRNDNTLQITIYATGGRHAGLTPVYVGPADEVREVYAHAYRLRIIGSLIIVVISCVLGTLSLLLWLRQRESLYLFYGAAELLWALKIGDTLIERTPLPWPWWGALVCASYAIAPALICKFSLAVMDLHHGLLKRLSYWHLIVSVPVALLVSVASLPWLWSIWLGITVSLSVWVAVVVIIHGIRHPALERRILAIAVLATAATALRDLIAIEILPHSYGDIAWVRYAWVAFAMTLAWVIAERLRKNAAEIAEMNQMLSERLSAREAELGAAFSHQVESERQQAMMDERQRITRDMHDGLGSQLLGALQLAQNPAVSRDVVAHQLRETLDHLKLTVDAMHDIDGDIASLLGAFRYRIAPRLEAAGIRLSWSVAPLPTIPDWTLRQSRNLQMILFELFSNMMAHARATHSSLVAATDAENRHIVITLTDDGCGFDLQSMASGGGRGMLNMQLRASHLGAQLRIQSSPEGTQASLLLPL